MNAGLRAAELPLCLRLILECHTVLMEGVFAGKSEGPGGISQYHRIGSISTDTPAMPTSAFVPSATRDMEGCNPTIGAYFNAMSACLC